MPKYAKITGNTRQWLKINKQIQGKKNHFCKDFLRQIIIREKKNCFPIIIKAINKELKIRRRAIISLAYKTLNSICKARENERMV